MRKYLDRLVRRAGRAVVIATALLAMLAANDATAGGYPGRCGVLGDLQQAGLPHESCAWNGGSVRGQTLYGVSFGQDCMDATADECTINADFFDSLTGEFIENRNIKTDNPASAGGPPCNMESGEPLCGEDDDLGDDCGDGSAGSQGGAIDDSCGCNSDEGDEGCCFEKVGEHSVLLKDLSYTRTDRDLVINGPGVQISFDRFYNSRRADMEYLQDSFPERFRWRQRYPSFMGYGWRHRYQERIRVLMPEWVDGYVPPGGSSPLDYGRSSIIYYRADGVGTVCGESTFYDDEYDCAGSQDRIQKVRGDPLFIVIKPGGERHLFPIDPSAAGIQPIDLPLRRIEAHQESAGRSDGMRPLPGLVWVPPTGCGRRVRMGYYAASALG